MAIASSRHFLLPVVPSSRLSLGCARFPQRLQSASCRMRTQVCLSEPHGLCALHLFTAAVLSKLEDPAAARAVDDLRVMGGVSEGTIRQRPWYGRTTGLKVHHEVRCVRACVRACV